MSDLTANDDAQHGTPSRLNYEHEEYREFDQSTNPDSIHPPSQDVGKRHISRLADTTDLTVERAAQLFSMAVGTDWVRATRWNDSPCPDCDSPAMWVKHGKARSSWVVGRAGTEICVACGHSHIPR
jgi:hypothetical protein